MVATLEHTADGWVARVAAKVVSVVDLDRLVGYAELSTPSRLARTRSEDVTYLARLHAASGDAVLGFRRAHRSFTITAALRRRYRTEAELAAAEVLDLMLHAPEHVVVEKCEPDEPVHGPTAELRRRYVFEQPRRPDAGVRYYLSVPPMRSSPQEWAALLNSLGSASLTVTLAPVRPDLGFSAALAAVADQYDRLAMPSVYRTDGLYGGAVNLAAEPFAVHASRLYRDAAERYRGPVYRMWVALTGVEDRGLLDALASALRAEHPLVRQAEVPPLFRSLRDLADPYDAAQVVSLPTGPLGGFPVSAPASGRTTGRGLTIDRSTVTVEGDLFGGDKHALT